MAHSPGPWLFAGDGIRDADGHLVISDDDIYPRYYHIRHEHVANVRLLENAPTLLSTLRDLRDACQCAYAAGQISAEPFVRAGNVIAKAEGQ